MKLEEESRDSNPLSFQIEVAQHLLSSYSYLDPERAGMWGWSYGGYATLRTMQMDDGNVFKCSELTVIISVFLLLLVMQTF